MLTLAGMALLGLAPSIPVNAQATPKPTESVVTKDEAAKREMARKTDTDMSKDDDDPLLVDPMPMSYPWAAPGSLNMYHWTDYTTKTPAPGSVQEERQARERLRDERRRMRRERLDSMMRTYSPSAYTTNTDYNYTADTPGSSNNASRYSNDSQSSNRFSGYSGTSSYMANWSPMAATGDFLFVVRGNTLYKLKHSDMSIVTQKDLPMAAGNGSLSGSGGSNSGIGSDNQNGSSTSGLNTGTSTGNTGNSVNGIDPAGRSNSSSSSGSGTSGQNGANPGGNSGVNSTSGAGTGQNSTNSSDTSGSNRTNTDTSASRGRNNRNRTNQGSNRNSTSSNSYYGNGMSGSMMSNPPLSITTASDYVYVLRGSTIYQMRISDLSLVSQKDLPFMNMNGQSGSRNSSYQNDSNSSRQNNTSGTSRTDTNSGSNNSSANPGNSTPKTDQNNNNNGTANPNLQQPDANRSGQPGDMPLH